jgi:hypothetical protein
MLTVFKRYINLNPYGKNLKTPQAVFWFIGVGVIITLIAFSEGFIWGNLFNFYFKDSLTLLIRVPLCLGIGLIVFCLLWIIDTSFVLLDTTISPNEEEIKWYKSPERYKVLGGFFTRVLLVAISLYTTIPAITKLSVSSDIDKYITDYNLGVRAHLADSITVQFDKKLLD